MFDLCTLDHDINRATSRCFPDGSVFDVVSATSNAALPEARGIAARAKKDLQIVEYGVRTVNLTSLVGPLKP
jgi:hypothetical protein